MKSFRDQSAQRVVASRGTEPRSLGKTLAACCLVFALLAPGARAQDAGMQFDSPRVVSVRSASLLSDEGLHFRVDGGVWLRDDVALLRAQDLERLSAENRELRAKPVSTPTTVIVAVSVAAVVGLGLGVYLGVATCRETALCR